MAEVITQTARLTPYAKRPKQASGFVTAYYYEPMATDPGFDRGNLYAVIEVLVTGRASEDVANLIIDTIGDYYYNQPDTAHADASSRFEGAIRAVNHELGAHVNRGNAAWIGKLSAVVAVEVDGELHVAQSGSGEAFLYRGSSHTRITTTPTNRPASPTKTFGSIASGQLEIGDRILLATPALIHQIPLERLQSIIGGANPNTVIAEFHDLLDGTSADRIAALVVEITTPELAALRVRSEQPSEIHLAPAESPLVVAKHVAAPLAHNTADSTKKIAGKLHIGWKSLRPRLRAAGLAVAERIRNLLGSRRGRIGLLAGVVVLVTLIGLAIWHQADTGSDTALLNSYQAAYSEYTHAQQQLSAGEKPAAQESLNSAQQQLAELTAKQAVLNRELAKAKQLSPGEPRTLSALKVLIAASLNQIAGLVEVNATTVASLPSTNAQAKQFEIYHGEAYIFDASNDNKLTIVNLSTGALVASNAKTSQLGVVVDTAISASDTGIYILTAQPSVWFYSFATDDITSVGTSANNWPSAEAIGSFGTNLYLLVNGSVIKYTKTGDTYSSGKPEVVPTNSTPSTSLAVDGSIYIATTTSLNRYFGGTLSGAAALPTGITKLVHLRSTDNTTLIIGTDSPAGRIALWSDTGNSPAFKEQISLNHVATIYGANYDQTTDLMYATSGGTLLSFPYSQ